MKRVSSIFVLALVMMSALVTPASANPQKDWTFMVFLNADNNLDPFGVSDVEEMARVGSSDFLNIVVEIDRENGPAQIQYIEKNKINVVKDMGEVDMGDYNHMVDFVKFCHEKYPAKNYALIVWNHGSGWKDAHGAMLKGISYDDSSNNHMTTEQLGLAVKEIRQVLGKKLDVFSMDACLMQMVEVAYAVRNDCDFVVASEEVEPGEGYPYDGILAKLEAGMGAADFVKPWVKAYADSYNGGSQGTSAATQSAIKCSELDNLRDAVDGFCKAVIAGNYSAQFKTALTSVQKFYYRTNIDLQHLAELLKNKIDDEGFKTANTKLLAALGKAIYTNGTCGATMRNAKGLAVYFPVSNYSFDKAYLDLAWAHDSMWDEMVLDYYKKLTAQKILSDLEKRDTTSLAEFVASNPSPELAAYVIEKVNFAIFTEGGYDQGIQATVKNLIAELKNR